ncbi:MAG: FadR family transcriptional regulator [Firmicutes bacterium]|nr:FadR family transcriptional regulator [Bacillota bacterium]
MLLNNELESKSLVESTSEEIVRIIIDNEYKAGQKLPNEYELSKQLGVSRNTIREAIRALVSRNVVEIRRGAGTFVSQRLGIADDPLGLTFLKDKDKVFLDLIQVRFMLEPPIAALAAQNATEADIEKLGQLCDEVEQLLLVGADPVQKDIEFHTQIAKCSQNMVVPNLIPIINAAITVFTNIKENRVVSQTIGHHREIFEAIRDHQPNDAQDAMLLHLSYNRNKLRKSIKSKVDLASRGGLTPVEG